MSKEEKGIIVFTDGAAKGNPGPGGWGAVVVQGDEVTEIGGNEADTTNNRMELMAAIGSLRFLSNSLCNEKGETCACKVYTDSHYVMKGINTWIDNWKANGWKTKAKKPVLNQDLWMELDELREGKDIEWLDVEAHAGVEGNERADAIASDMAEGKVVNLFSGPLSEYAYDVVRLE